MPVPTKPELAVPERYALGPELGRGGMATVYRARDLQLDREVALKVLHPHRHGQELVREAQVLAKLRHPAVVTVYDVMLYRDRVFVAMELVEGSTLRAFKGDKLAALIRAGEGLAAVHDAKLVHRDFKPDNVLVGKNGDVRVADFGLARQAELLGDEPLAGTLPYMAPEVLRGSPADARSDQYAFAVALIELLGGARPFGGETRDAYLVATATAPVIGDDVPRRIATIARRALSPDPEDRYPSMAALLRDLQPRNRRVLAGVIGGAVVAGGIATAIFFATRSAPAATCAVPPALDAVWNAERAKAVDTALAKDESARKRVPATLDAYRVKLGEAYVAACRSAATDGPDLAAARATCLDRSTAQLRSIVDQLIAVDDKNRARAIPALDAMAPISDCESIALLGAPVQRKATLRDEGAAIDAEIARAVALKEFDHFAEAKGVIDAIATRVVKLDHPPTLALYQLELGTILERLDDVPDAEASFRAAIISAQTGHDDTVLVRSAIALALDLSRIQRKPADGRTWADLAFATASRMPTAPLLQMRANFALAILMLAVDDLDGAEQHGALAYETCKRENASPTMCGEHLNTLGGVALHRGDFDLAEKRYREALAIIEETRGKGSMGTFAVISNLGSIAYARGDFEASASLRANLIESATKVVGSKHSNVGETSLLLGVTFEQLGKLDEAIAATKRGLEILEAARGSKFERVREAKAQLYREQLLAGDRTALDRARALAKEEGAIPPTIVAIIEIEILAARTDKRFADMKRLCEEALEISQREKLAKLEPTARIMLAYAILLREQKDPQAKEMAQIAVQLAEDIFAPGAALPTAARAELAR